MLGKLWHWQGVPGMAGTAPGPAQAAPKQTCLPLIPGYIQACTVRSARCIGAEFSSDSDTTALNHCPLTLSLHQPGFQHSVYMPLINAVVPASSISLLKISVFRYGAPKEGFTGVPCLHMHLVFDQGTLGSRSHHSAFHAASLPYEMRFALSVVLGESFQAFIQGSEFR